MMFYMCFVIVSIFLQVEIRNLELINDTSVDPKQM